MGVQEHPHTRSGPTALGVSMLVVMLATAAGGLWWAFTAQTEAPPEHLVVPTAETESVEFDIAPMDRVCRQFADEMGMVDYTALKDNPEDLLAFLSQVKAVSPHSNFATFPREDEALAYWINAYNAWMMKAVIDACPVESVKDIEPAVFDDQFVVCGGEEMSLNFIENEIIRKEFAEPRIHFAVNCASMGCPWLPREAFFPDRLDEQLERETKRFFAAESHLNVSREENAVYLSPLLQWYAEDFRGWLRAERGVEDPTAVDFVRIYAPEGAPEITDDMQVRWQRYDWRLNDSNAPWAESRGKFRPAEGDVTDAPGQ